MNIQSAISECDKAHAILVALLSYETSASPDQSVIQGLLYAAESSLEQVNTAIKNKLNDSSDPDSSYVANNTAQED